MANTDQSGVSAVLGFVLVLAIIIGALEMIQLLFVPTWMKNAESIHYFQLKNDFEKITEKLIDASNNGLSVVNLNLEMMYPKYPFLLTPNKVSSSLVIEKIGTIRSPLFSKELNLTAIILIPNYYYLNLDYEEVMILGEYFVNGKNIGENKLYDGKTVRLIVFDGEEKSFAGKAEILIQGGGCLTYEGSNWINITVKPGYEWYIEYLKQTFGRYGDLDGRSINVTFDANTTFLVCLSNYGIEQNLAEIIDYRNATTFMITDSDGSSDTLSQGETKEIYFNLGKGKELSSLPTVYLTGYVGPDVPVNVSITYEIYESGEEEGELVGTVTENFTWYSLHSGYFQLPITPPGGVKGTIIEELLEEIFNEGKEKWWIDTTIVLVFPDGTHMDFTLRFKVAE